MRGVESSGPAPTRADPPGATGMAARTLTFPAARGDGRCGDRPHAARLFGQQLARVESGSLVDAHDEDGLAGLEGLLDVAHEVCRHQLTCHVFLPGVQDLQELGLDATALDHVPARKLRHVPVFKRRDQRLVENAGLLFAPGNPQVLRVDRIDATPDDLAGLLEQALPVVLRWKLARQVQDAALEGHIQVGAVQGMGIVDLPCEDCGPPRPGPALGGLRRLHAFHVVLPWPCREPERGESGGAPGPRGPGTPTQQRHPRFRYPGPGMLRGWSSAASWPGCRTPTRGASSAGCHGPGTTRL